MTTSQELSFLGSYKLNDNTWNTKNLSGEFGLTAITQILNDKLQANRNLLASKQSSYNTKLSQYNTAVNGNQTLQNKTNLYNRSVTDKTVLGNQLSQKQTVYNSLNNEVNGGVFVQNGQTFSLGKVGSQVTAQSSTYSKLSASLGTRLASLDGQIRQAQSQQSNAQYNVTTWGNRYTNYSNDANYYTSLSLYYSRLYWNGAYGQRYKPSNMTNANYYNGLASAFRTSASNALSSKNYWQTQLSGYNTQIATLQSAK